MTDPAPQPSFKIVRFTGQKFFVPQSSDPDAPVFDVMAAWHHCSTPATAALTHAPVWGPWDPIANVAMCQATGCDLAAWREAPEPADGVAPAGIPFQVDEVSTAEVVIAGRAMDLAKPPSCAHRQFGQEVKFANMVDEGGALVARRIQVKARCMECGAPVRFLTRQFPEGDADVVAVPDGLVSDDGLTVAVMFEPVESHARVLVD